MKERDKELEDNDVYRRKIWHESLEMINTNLSNMLSCISELESTVILKVEIAYISGDKYEKQAYGTLTNFPRTISEN